MIWFSHYPLLPAGTEGIGVFSELKAQQKPVGCRLAEPGGTALSEKPPAYGTELAQVTSSLDTNFSELAAVNAGHAKWRQHMKRIQYKNCVCRAAREEDKKPWKLWAGRDVTVTHRRFASPLKHNSKYCIRAGRLTLACSEMSVLNCWQYCQPYRFLLALSIYQGTKLIWIPQRNEGVLKPDGPNPK